MLQRRAVFNTDSKFRMNLDQDACIITSTAEHDSTSHPEMDELILTKNVDIAYNGLLLIISSTGPGRVFISDE